MRTFSPTRQVSGAAALSFTGLDLASLSPQLNAKYSPNLYAFMTSRRQRGFAPRARVWLDDGETLWLGYFDDIGAFVGLRMNQVLCDGAKASPTCPLNLGPLREVSDFWEQYAQDGRCAVDRDHSSYFVNGDTRWRVNGDTRHCLWCGKASQRLVRREVTQVHEEWVAT